MADDGRRVHPDCRNASNPYHECSEYCLKIIAETLPRMADDGRRVHPDCRNASNPYHECSEYCLKIIAEKESESVQASSAISKPVMPLHDGDEDRNDERVDSEQDDGENVTEDFANLTGRKKRLSEAQLKMNEARKANQTAMEAPSESRGISKQKWIEEQKWTKNVEDCLDFEESNKMKDVDSHQ